MRARSGDRYEIANGAFRAVITEIGASLRLFEDGNRAILWGYASDELAGGGRGQVLCPWPNRLEDGTFRFDGIDANAALDDAALHNAIHGLVRWLAWDLTEQTPEAVALSCLIVPQPGYPFRVALELRYRLSATGLEIETTLRNADDRRAPLGLGFHPYFAPSERGLDDASLFVPAKSHVRLDARGLPVGIESAADGFATITSPGGGMLRGLVLDDCFTDLARDRDGRWRVVFASDPATSDRTEIWGDASFTHVMCFTGDTLGRDAKRKGIAIEPMTCAPNALRTGSDLIVLDPGESFTCTWGVRVAH